MFKCIIATALSTPSVEYVEYFGGQLTTYLGHVQNSRTANWLRVRVRGNSDSEK